MENGIMGLAQGNRPMDTVGGLGRSNRQKALREETVSSTSYDDWAQRQAKSPIEKADFLKRIPRNTIVEYHLDPSNINNIINQQFGAGVESFLLLSAIENKRPPAPVQTQTVSEQIVQEAMPQAMPQGMPQGIQQAMPQGMPQGMPPGISQAMPQEEIITDTISETGIAANDPQNIGMAQGGIVGYAVGGMMPGSTYEDYEKLLAALPDDGDVLDDPFGPSSVEDVTEDVTEDVRENYNPFKSPVENVPFMPSSKSDPREYVEELQGPGGELEAFGIDYDGLNEKRNARLEKQRENLDSGRNRMGSEAALRGFLNLASSNNPNFVQAASNAATVGLEEYMAEDDRLTDLDTLIADTDISYAEKDIQRAENNRSNFRKDRKDRTDLQLELIKLNETRLKNAKNSGDPMRVESMKLTLQIMKDAGIDLSHYPLDYGTYSRDITAIDKVIYHNLNNPNDQKDLPAFRGGTRPAQALAENLAASLKAGPSEYILGNQKLEKNDDGSYVASNNKKFFYQESSGKLIPFDPLLSGKIKNQFGRNSAM